MATESDAIRCESLTLLARARHARGELNAALRGYRQVLDLALSRVPHPSPHPDSAQGVMQRLTHLPPGTQAQGKSAFSVSLAQPYLRYPRLCPNIAAACNAGARAGQEAAAAAAGPRPDEHPGGEPAHQRHQHAGDGAGPEPRLERRHHGLPLTGPSSRAEHSTLHCHLPARAHVHLWRSTADAGTNGQGRHELLVGISQATPFVTR